MLWQWCLYLLKPQLQTTSSDPISAPHLTWVHFTTQDILLCTLNYALSRVTSVPPSLLSLMTYYVRSVLVIVYPRSSRRSYVYATLHKSTVPGISILLCVFPYSIPISWYYQHYYIHSWHIVCVWTLSLNKRTHITKLYQFFTLSLAII